MKRVRQRGSKFHHETNVQTDGIAFLSDSSGGYSGGRYYEYTLALAAKEHTKVKYYNQGGLPFVDNFTLYQQPPIVSIPGIESFDMQTASAFFGSQIRGAVHAIQQGFKYKRPVFITIYESPKSMSSNIHVTKNSKLAEEMHVFEQIKLAINRYKEDIPFLKIITLTNEAKDDLVKYLEVEENQVCVIPPCINDRVCSSVDFDGDKEDFLLYVGRNNYRKNLKVLLKIYAKVKDKYDLHMILDSEDGLPEIATEYGIPHSKIKTYSGLSDFKRE
jgi:glycosyltransferase involved in cell wall biosynthesis